MGDVEMLVLTGVLSAVFFSVLACCCCCGCCCCLLVPSCPPILPLSPFRSANGPF